jgi:hypothetical protein
MKSLILLSLIFNFFIPVFAYESKNYEKESFEKIKQKKIEYLKKRINCVKRSNNFKEMKKCWKKNKNN